MGPGYTLVCGKPHAATHGHIFPTDVGTRRTTPLDPMTVSILCKKLGPIWNIARVSCVLWCRICDCIGGTSLRCDPMVPHSRRWHTPKSGTSQQFGMRPRRIVPTGLPGGIYAGEVFKTTQGGKKISLRNW